MNGQNKIPVPKVSDDDGMINMLIQNPNLYRVKNPKDAQDVIKNFEDALDKKRPLRKRIRSFISGQSKLSRGIGGVLDFVTLFVPYGEQINNGRDAIRLIAGRKQKQMEQPMLDKILSLKNFVNVKDEYGNISPQEILASVIQLVIAGAVVWGAVELGIWEQLSQLLGIGE